MEPQSVLALTATAGPRVVDDICQSLEIPRGAPEEDGGVVTLATNRDNIDVKCVFLESQEERLDKVSRFVPVYPSSRSPITILFRRSTAHQSAIQASSKI